MIKKKQALLLYTNSVYVNVNKNDSLTGQLYEIRNTDEFIYISNFPGNVDYGKGHK